MPQSEKSETERFVGVALKKKKIKKKGVRVNMSSKSEMLPNTIDTGDI